MYVRPYNKTYDKEDLFDETTSLQITDILNQMNDMLSHSMPYQPESTNNVVASGNKTMNYYEPKNVLRIDVNNQNATMTKHVWNIPVNSSIVDMPLVEDSATNMTHHEPSIVDTLERLQDLNYVVSKLNNLKSQLETSF